MKVEAIFKTDFFENTATKKCYSIFSTNICMKRLLYYDFRLIIVNY